MKDLLCISICSVFTDKSYQSHYDNVLSVRANSVLLTCL